MANQTETIEIFISEDGSQIELEAKGFKGKACSIVDKDIAKALGLVTDTQKKAEFYSKTDEDDVIIRS